MLSFDRSIAPRSPPPTRLCSPPSKEEPMPTHELKTWPELYDVVVSGRKSFEARRDDRGFAEGDVLHLREYGPGRGGYTGRHTERFVNFVLHGPAFGVEEGHVVMAI